MLIEFDRESVCMGDDCHSHIESRQIDGSLMTSKLLEELVHYVPSMENVIWAIYFDNSRFGKIIGFILTDEHKKAAVELSIKDMPLEDLFAEEENPKKEISERKVSVSCRYYHDGRFTWRDGNSGKLIEKYPKYSSLFEKVKKDCGIK